MGHCSWAKSALQTIYVIKVILAALCYSDRVESSAKILTSLQRLNYLLAGPLQKKFADLWSRNKSSLRKKKWDVKATIPWKAGRPWIWLCVAFPLNNKSTPRFIGFPQIWYHVVIIELLFGVMTLSGKIQQLLKMQHCATVKNRKWRSIVYWGRTLEREVRSWKLNYL